MPDPRLFGSALFALGLLASSASAGAATEASNLKKAALASEVAW
jgi:hypothetical protein